MKNNKLLKKLILFILVSCLLFSTSVFASIYVVSGDYEINNKTYEVDSNGLIKNNSSDDDSEDDTDDEDDSDYSDDDSDDEDDSSEDDSSDDEDDDSYSEEDDVIVNDEFTLDDAEVIIPYSQLSVIDGDETQLDLFGICMSGDIGSYAGNKNYLGNTTLLNEFYDWLDKAKYSTDTLKLLIEKIKNILGVISGTVQGKEYMQYDEDVLSAVQARQIMVKTIQIQKTLEVIFFCLGVIMMVYGFCLILSWVFDKSLLPLMSETGLLENGMLGLITLNHLRADDDCIDKNSVSFVKVAILGFACAGVGALMISPSFRGLLGEAIKGFSNIFGNT